MSYRKTHTYRVSLNYYSYDSELESYEYFNPWEFIGSDNDTILIYSYCNHRHSIIINSKTLYNANKKIDEIKTMFKNEKNIIIKKKDIKWEGKPEEVNAVDLISKWWKQKLHILYNPHTKIGKRFALKLIENYF